MTKRHGPNSLRRIPLAQIDAIVAAELGPARVKGNAQPAAFARQVAMYLAKHIGHWSTTQIGHYYNGRDHSTVCHAVRKIDRLRSTDPEVHATIESLTAAIQANVGDNLSRQRVRPARERCSRARPEWVEQLADALIDRLFKRLEQEVLLTTLTDLPAARSERGTLV